MNVDLHTHTYPASDCSRISYRDYIAWCVDHAIEAVALTNHGDISDNLHLGPALAAEGVLLIDGIEISTLFGDFVIFSPDLDYLSTLRSVQDAPRAGRRPGGRRGRLGTPGRRRRAQRLRLLPGHREHGRRRGGRRGGLQRLVARRPVRRIAEQIAAELGAARTGGSDAHDPAELMACYTELPDPVRSTADVVQALRQRRTVPHRRKRAGAAAALRAILGGRHVDARGETRTSA